MARGRGRGIARTHAIHPLQNADHVIVGDRRRVVLGHIRAFLTSSCGAIVEW